MTCLTDRDPGDEQPPAVAAETEETEEAVEYTIHGLIVAETCAGCGLAFRYLPVGQGSRSMWAEFFVEQALRPAYCPRCAAMSTTEDA